MQFEWDQNKAKLNYENHQIHFSEASTIFADPLELTILDPDHSVGEFRYLSIGKSSNGTLMIVSYTEREPDIIRIISARKVTIKEQKYYEQNHYNR